ncbi:MAG: hypothetical protein RR531_11720 [Longicatena sp.]
MDDLEWRLDRIISLLEEISGKLDTVESNTSDLYMFNSKIDEVISEIRVK